MNTATSIETLDYIESSGKALHAAGVLASKVASDAEKVAQVVPARVNLLVEAGLITETEKSAAVSQLSTHQGALAVVKNLVDILGETKQAYDRKLAMAGQGRAVPTGNGQSNKEASTQTQRDESNYVGRRTGLGEKSAADDAMINGLGLTNRLRRG